MQPNCLFVLFFTFAAIIPTLTAHIGDFDEVWQKRAEEAKKAALEANSRIPADFNLHFHKWVNNLISFSLGLSFFVFNICKSPIIKREISARQT